MHMQVIGVDMDGRHSLVVAEADGFAKLVLNGVQHFNVGPLTGREGIDKVIGLFRLRLGVGPCVAKIRIAASAGSSVPQLVTR